MSNHEGDRPAFPRPSVVWKNDFDGKQTGEQGVPGMTLREYYAGLAMQGLLAPGARLGKTRFDDVATLAVAHADALIAALKQGGE